MATAIPAKLAEAQISQFARRAIQLDKFKPIVAYWLRFYMTQKILSKNLHLADPECTAYATQLMEKLEQTKADYPSEDALHDDMAAHAYCEQFALHTFAKGDNDIRADKVTAATADTLLAASTFLELLSIWKDPPEPEIRSKMTYAKYHAVRITKAIRAGEDPNLSNPKQQSPVASPAPLDPNDPEVQHINGETQQPSGHQGYQPYVETAPNTSAHPSPTFTPAAVPSETSGYAHDASATFTVQQDMSPVSQPAHSRQGSGSVVSVGGGYFPRVDVPTFTAETAPAVPSSSMDTDMTNPYDFGEAPPAAPSPHPLQPEDGRRNEYQDQAPPNAGPQSPTFLQQPPHPPAIPASFQPQQRQPPQPYGSATAGTMHSTYQSSFRTDEDSVAEAQKHAKWAISALNFEDVNTAVKELRAALQALGAT